MRWFLVLLVLASCSPQVLSVGQAPIESSTITAEPLVRFDIERRQHTTTWETILEAKTRDCVAGDRRVCFSYAGWMDRRIVNPILRRLCQEKDRYACRVLRYEQVDNTPTDCEQELDLEQCLGRWRHRPTKMRKLSRLLLDGCKHGIARECFLFGLNDALTETERREAWRIGCEAHYPTCTDLARAELRRGNARDARYYLEVECQLQGSCLSLHAAYAGGIVRELYPGRFADVKNRPCDPERRKRGLCFPSQAQIDFFRRPPSKWQMWW